MVSIKQCLVFALFLSCSLGQTFGMLGRAGQQIGSQAGRKAPGTKSNPAKQQHFGQKNPSYSPWKATFARYFWGKSKKETNWNEEFKNWGKTEKEKKGWGNFFGSKKELEWSNSSNKSTRTQSASWKDEDFKSVLGSGQRNLSPQTIVQIIKGNNAYGQAFQVGDTVLYSVLHYVINNNFSNDVVIAVIDHLVEKYNQQNILSRFFIKKWAEKTTGDNSILDAAVNTGRDQEVIEKLCKLGALDDKSAKDVIDLLLKASSLHKAHPSGKFNRACWYFNNIGVLPIVKKIKFSSFNNPETIELLLQNDYHSIVANISEELAEKVETIKNREQKDREKRKQADIDAKKARQRQEEKDRKSQKEREEQHKADVESGRYEQRRQAQAEEARQRQEKEAEKNRKEEEQRRKWNEEFDRTTAGWRQAMDEEDRRQESERAKQQSYQERSRNAQRRPNTTAELNPELRRKKQEITEVFEKCTKEEDVQSTWRLLIMRHHPDHFSDPIKKAEAEELTKYVNTERDRTLARF